MSFKMIITAMALAFVLAGCSAKENHDNTAGDNNNNNPQPTEHNDNIVDDAGDAVKDVCLPIRPQSAAKQYPEYIPQPIREDYEEACAVLQLSPKASATLARRCLQGMIRDFWGISKDTLNAEINALKDRVQPDLWAVLNSLRQLGNIGAHMEKDTNLIVEIDPGEAEKLIKLIELLMKEWYINRHERNQLFGDILQINAEKQAIRNGEG